MEEIREARVQERVHATNREDAKEQAEMPRPATAGPNKIYKQETKFAPTKPSYTGADIRVNKKPQQPPNCWNFDTYGKCDQGNMCEYYHAARGQRGQTSSSSTSATRSEPYSQNWDSAQWDAWEVGARLDEKDYWKAWNYYKDK